MRPHQVPTVPNLDAVRARRESLRQAMGRFESALAVPAVGRIPDWAPGVAAALRQLEYCATEHVAATEGPGGFHTEIVAASPRLQRGVTVLVAEHRKISQLLDQLRRATEHARSDSHVGGIREQGTQLLALLARHRQRGADLIFEAYQRDLGAGD